MSVEEPIIQILKNDIFKNHKHLGSNVDYYITFLNNIYKSYIRCSYIPDSTTNSLDIVSKINILKEQCKKLEDDTKKKAQDILEKHFKNNHTYTQHYSTFSTYYSILNKIGETNCDNNFDLTMEQFLKELDINDINNKDNRIKELQNLIDNIKDECSGKTEISVDDVKTYINNNFTETYKSLFNDFYVRSFIYYLVIRERAIHYRNKLSQLYSDSNGIEKINKIIEYIKNVSESSFTNDTPINNAYNPDNDSNDKKLQTYTEKIEYLISANNKLNTFKEQSFEILQKISSDNGCTQRKNKYIVDLLDTIDSISTKITNIISEIEKVIEDKIDYLGNSYKRANTRLADNKRVFDRLMNDISNKKNVVATRDRMLQLSQERNVYKQKVMNILISSLVAIIIMIIFSYTVFSKK